LENKSIAVVTGSSSGIGYETSLALSRDGIYTYATMRDTARSDTMNKIVDKEHLPLEILELDVNNEESVIRGIQQIIDKENRIDILVNNAGYGLFGALEDISMDEIKRQFETNFFGAIRTIKEVLPTMRDQKSGIIVNVSSLSGLVGIPAQCIYCSSKFALEGLSESISYELQPFGIKVILIEPGVINTSFVPNIKYPRNAKMNSENKPLKLDAEDEDQMGSGISQYSITSQYSKTVNRFLSHYYPAMMNAPSPKAVSAVIMDAIKAAASSSSQSLFRYKVGEDSKSLAEAKKSLPDSQFHEYVSKATLQGFA
jgi:NAD(P)-dependent dehydrogenase (short-subunit alcohol dehydrogenase family)